MRTQALGRSLRIAFWSLLASLAVMIASCSGSDADGPTSPVPRPRVTLSCIADVRAQTMSCPTESAAPSTPASLSVMFGGQGINVRLTSTDVAYNSGLQIFSANVTVQNLIEQAMGTADGTSLDPDGIRVFFHTGPIVTGGTGTVTVANPDGIASFTAPGQPYFQYNQVLAPNATSSAHSWQWNVPNSVSTFGFTVYVDAEVKYPGDYLDVQPQSVTLFALGATQTFTGTRRRVNGDVLSGPSATWESSNPAVASIDPNSGVLSSHAAGTVTVTGTSGTLVGTATVVVSPPTTISKSAGDNQSAMVGTSVAVAPKVRLTDQGGNPTPGIEVTFSVASGGGNVTGGSQVTDVDGYATVGSWTLGTAVGTGNNTLTATAGSLSTTFTASATAGAAATITIVAGDAQSRAVGSAVTTAPTVLVQDSHGNPVPDASVTFSISGGNGSVTGGSTTTNASGQASVGSWTLGNGGASCSAASLTSCSRNALTATVSGGSNPSVSFRAFVPPFLPTTASYQSVGNATVAVSAAIGALKDAYSINGDGANGTGATLSIASANAIGPSGSTVTFTQSTGAFTYLATFVSSGASTEDIGYTVTDGISSIDGSATLSFNVPARVWYVQPGFSGTSTGTQAAPYKHLGSTAGDGVQSVAQADEAILVLTGTGSAAGGTLKNGQTVHGQGAGAYDYVLPGSVATYRNGGSTIALLAAGVAPAITSPTGTALTLASNNTVRGIALTASGGTGISGSAFGTLTVSQTSVTATGTALDLSSGTLSGSFTSLTSTGGTRNIRLSSVTASGSVALGSGALSGASTEAFSVTGGSGNLTYSGSITATNLTRIASISSRTGGILDLQGSLSCTIACTGISVSSNTGGTVLFSNGTQKLINTSGSSTAAVTLSSNTGSTISFTGGNLAITGGVNNGFVATGGGTVNVTGGGNTIATTSGMALKVDSTTIGASGLTFQSINKTLISTNGIFLRVTGTLGGLTVTGNAGLCRRTDPDCTGGTIAGSSGATGLTNGIGVYLSDVQSVSLTRMRINGVHDNYGIYGTSVRGLTLNFVLMDGTYGTAGDLNEGTVAFDELSGSGTVSNSYFANGASNNFRVRNVNSGTTLNRLTLSSDTIGFTNTTAASGDGLKIQVDAGTTNVTVTNSAFRGAYANSIEAIVRGGTADLVVQNSRFGNGQSNTSSTFGHIVLVADSATPPVGNITYTYSNNVLNGARQAAIYVQKIRGSQTITGTIQQNSIGLAGVDSGSVFGQDIRIEHTTRGKHKVLIDLNNVQRYNSIAGIFARFVGPPVGSTAARDGSLHITLTRNTTSNPGPSGIIDGVSLFNNGQTTDNYTMCVNFGNFGGLNTLSSGGNASGAPYSVGPVTPSNGTGFFKLRGLTGGPYTGSGGNTPVENRISADNAVGAVPPYVEFPSSGSSFFITASTDNARGVTCDLP